MGHRIREWSPEQYYHVSSRGNRKEPLFLSGEDYSVFLQLLSKIHEKYPIELTSYCLMTNHYHLQIRSPEVSLSKVMALLNKRYAHYFNKKYDKTGHLFEKRFFSKRVEGLIGMAEVSRYIHYNPVKACMVSEPQLYQWSSYRSYYSSYTSYSFLNKQPLLSLFNHCPQAYHEWCIMKSQ